MSSRFLVLVLLGVLLTGCGGDPAASKPSSSSPPGSTRPPSPSASRAAVPPRPQARARVGHPFVAYIGTKAGQWVKARVTLRKIQRYGEMSNSPGKDTWLSFWKATNIDTSTLRAPDDPMVWRFGVVNTHNVQGRLNPTYAGSAGTANGCTTLPDHVTWTPGKTLHACSSSALPRGSALKYPIFYSGLPKTSFAIQLT